MAKRKNASTAYAPYTTLPGVNFPPASGDHLLDCEAGAQQAQEFLRTLAKGDGHYLLGWIVRDMIESGKFSGVEIGFFGALSRALNPFAKVGRTQSLLVARR